MIPENNKPLMVLVDAFRNLIYCDQFTWQRNEWVSRGEIQALKPDEILSSLSSPTLVAGPGLEGMSKTQLDLLSQRATRLPPLDLTMSAQHLAIFASRQQKPLSRIEWRELKPLYIRDSEAEEKLKAGFLKPLGIQNKWVDS
jgi:N6-L-threonylcarbamoyladenine synthase/tRNA threonylcarbamoyladenosine biosynthesis protein TsaB